MERELVSVPQASKDQFEIKYGPLIMLAAGWLNSQSSKIPGFKKLSFKA